MRNLSLLDAPPDPVAQGPIVDCELCVVDSPIYQLDRPCCMVREALQETRDEVRQAMLQWWEKKNAREIKVVSKEVKEILRRVELILNEPNKEDRKLLMESWEAENIRVAKKVAKLVRARWATRKTK